MSPREEGKRRKPGEETRHCRGTGGHKKDKSEGGEDKRYNKIERKRNEGNSPMTVKATTNENSGRGKKRIGMRTHDMMARQRREGGPCSLIVLGCLVEGLVGEGHC